MRPKVVVPPFDIQETQLPTCPDVSEVGVPGPGEPTAPHGDRQNQSAMRDELEHAHNNRRSGSSHRLVQACDLCIRRASARRSFESSSLSAHSSVCVTPAFARYEERRFVLSRKGVSRYGVRQAPLPCRGECQARHNIVAREVGKVRQNLVLSHAARQVLQHVVHGDPRPSDAWLSAPHRRIHRDSFLPVHDSDCIAKISGLGGGILRVQKRGVARCIHISLSVPLAFSLRASRTRKSSLPA